MKMLKYLILFLSFSASGQLIMTSVGNQQGGGGTTNPPSDANYFVGGAGASDSNPGTSLLPFATIQAAANIADNGDIVDIRSGVYRETITPSNSGTSGDSIIFRAATGATVTVSGAEDAGTSGWTLEAANIWKKTLTPPLSTQWATSISSNTTLLNNQVWNGGVMMLNAQFPNAPNSIIEDWFVRDNWEDGGTQAQTSVTSSSLPAEDPAGSAISRSGWFITKSSAVNSRSGQQLNLGPGQESGSDFWKRWIWWGALGLLDATNEFYWSSTTLYVRSVASPLNITYKGRNFGFDLSNRSYIVVRGINFFGCKPAHGNSSSAHNMIDGRTSVGSNDYSTAYYTNHGVFAGNQNSGLDVYSGINLGGTHNTIRNLDFKYSSGTVVYAGPNSVVYNNRFQWISYCGNYGAACRPLVDADGIDFSRNTILNVGRSAFDYGYQSGDTHTSMVISYNDMGEGGLISSDGSLLYGSQNVRLDGTRVHHNWAHHFNALQESSGGDKGAQIVFSYNDQHSGYVEYSYNAGWGSPNYTNGIAFHETDAIVPASYHYNNTWAGTSAQASYINYTDGNRDIIRNNIAINNLNWCNGSLDCDPGSAASNNFTGDPLFVGGFSAHDGRQFQVQSGSGARNYGVFVSGVTPLNNITAGCYQYGEIAWLPGITWTP